MSTIFAKKNVNRLEFHETEQREDEVIQKRQ